MPANNLYDHLINNNIIGSEGITTRISVTSAIKVQDVSVVGNIVQEWLGYYMNDNNLYYRIKDNTQEFPDFLLDENDSNTENLLEVKAFINSPNFDVANFTAYARSLRTHAYRLDAKYLIFEYGLSPENNGAIFIKNIWLKNVWEICCSSDRSPVKLQWKQGDPVNIRPATWYSNRAKFQPFENKLEFVEALYQVIRMSRLDQNIQNDWLNTVKTNYQETTNSSL